VSCKTYVSGLLGVAVAGLDRRRPVGGRKPCRCSGAAAGLVDEYLQEIGREHSEEIAEKLIGNAAICFSPAAAIRSRAVGNRCVDHQGIGRIATPKA